MHEDYPQNVSQTRRIFAYYKLPRLVLLVYGSGTSDIKYKLPGLVLLVYGSGTSDIKYRKYFDSDVKFVMF
jgi:hypothetical protein